MPIIDLDYARQGLRLTGNNTITDADLESLIEQAAPVIEDLVGSIVPTSRVETYDGGHIQIPLLHSPLVSVESVIETAGSDYVKTLTEQDPFAGSGFDAYGYTVDLDSGILTRRASGVAISFISGARNIQVTYTSGRAAVPGNILRAYRLLIRHLWQLELGRTPLVDSQQEIIGYTPAGFAVPNAVIELCADSARVSGIG